jgi:hypothetical protein
MAFRAEFGHFNVSQSKSSDKNHYDSLGRWCCGIRKAYEIMKEGGVSKGYKLSKGEIKCLGNAGFFLQAIVIFYALLFKEHMAFKKTFGHFNVPLSKSSDNNYYSLGRWCCGIRKAYEIMKEGGISKDYKLSKGDIQRLVHWH